MHVLIIHAHPEPQSLTSALKDFAVTHLRHRGAEVQVTDLYKQGWKAALDSSDSLGFKTGTQFDVVSESARAYGHGLQSNDIASEQAKLLWADVVIFQFPLWWFSMPAIMKGWIDRVFTNGFAYGVGEHSESHWGDRYGEGTLAGKRAMLAVTVGGWEPHYSDRGVNGSLDDLLFPIQHGTLFYAGLAVLPTFPVYRSHKVDNGRFEQLCKEYAQRLDNLEDAPTIPFRAQNGGDYDIPDLTLKRHILPEQDGLKIHRHG